ncbi:MAG TPA: AAA family ATPase [Streptosporangiaceae bacterium]|nr:AAA family ATPase [Streptosporangiaceae bacterium]
MKRVCLVGNSGSGKSTLAAALADKLGAAYLELDSVFHQPGWQPLEREAFRERIEVFTQAPTWVVDGNYGAVRDIVWSRADTIVWLDLPRRRVMRQLLGRTLRRMATGAELWNGNRERWQNLLRFDPEESILVWAWTKHAAYRERYLAAMNDPANSHLKFVRLRSRKDAAGWLTQAAGPRLSD